jgi:hypothetical protein
MLPETLTWRVLAAAASDIDSHTTKNSPPNNPTARTIRLGFIISSFAEILWK